MMALTMVLSGAMLIGSVSEDVEGAKSDRDSFGYYYIDSLAPSPQTSYSWLDVQGASGSTSLGLFGSSGHGQIDLSWDFPFYGGEFSRLHISARGYICFNSWYYSTYYSSGIPQTRSPNPMMAVMWGYGYGNAYYVTGTTNNQEWVAIEWVSNSYGMHYEVILYDSGVIKMQYKQSGSSSYTGGYYHTVGIEDLTGNEGIQYKSFYDQNMENAMAIEWSFAVAEVQAPVVINAHGNETSICYADYQEYEFTFNVTDDHPDSGAGDLNDIRVYFGPPSLGIYAQYTVLGGQAGWALGGGGAGPGNGTIDINISSSDFQSNVFGDPWNMVLIVKFTFAFPWEGMIPMTIWARGEVALPASSTFEDVFYLDTGVKMIGDFQFIGEDGRDLQTESFTKENETIRFTGVKIAYNNTDLSDPNTTFYPMNHSFYFSIIDDELFKYTDMNVSGRNFSVDINMPLRALRKEFRIYIMGIPTNRVRGELPVIAFKVDDSSPTAPSSLVIRADSFKDKERLVDNDDILYITWGTVTDTGSGVKHYKISSSPDPGNESAVIIDPRITSWIWNATVPGDFKLYVWAVDKVGHIGEMASQFIKIDKDDPFFTDIDPSDPTLWLKTLTPTVTISARDGWTISEDISGVRKSTAEYSTSTDGIDGFEDWISVGLFDDDITRATGDDHVEISVQPRFVEGTENYIKFRIKDWAGNGYAVSDAYNLRIDVTDVAYEDFFPTQDVWHNFDAVNSKEVSLYLVDHTSGVNTGDLYYRISHEIDDNGNYIWSTGVQPQGGWQDLPNRWYDRVDGNNMIWIHFAYEDFQEGELNFMQFISRDSAKNGVYTESTLSKDPFTMSPMYQILVNTKPVAIISEPMNFNPLTKVGEFNITDLITFDASNSFDIDVDAGNLKFEWKEGNSTLSKDMILENFRFETLGFHTITLYVGDSGHKGDERAVATVTVNITKFVPSRLKDTDRDGMDDDWEFKYLLNMYDPSDRNEDPDGDGYTNIQEYMGNDEVDPYKVDMDDTDPWDPLDTPEYIPVGNFDPIVKEAPFALWIFILVIVLAIIIAALIVLIGYLRIHREEDSDKREEAEEEAMLATPQLDLPTMPANLLTGDPADSPLLQIESLPPADPAMEQPMEPQPMEPQPIDMGQAQPVGDPMYQDPNQPVENPMYQDPNQL